MSNQQEVTKQRIESLLANNKDFQKSFQAPPEFLNFQRDPARPPAALILTCSDPRVVPEKYFGFGMGEYLVIRNAGGRASDAIRSLAVLDQAIKVHAVLVVHHTDCGLTHATNDWIRKGLKANAPDHAAEIDATDFGEIANADFDASLKHDVEFIRSSPYFRKDMIVKGYLYDLKTGSVTEKVSA